MAGKRRLTAPVKAFFEAYAGAARLNATEAARMVFRGSPDKANRVAADIKRRWPDLFEKAEDSFRSKIRVSDDELDEHLSEIARDKDHKDRLRALELVARMKGKLNDKLKVEIDRRGMMKEIENLLQIIPLPGQIAQTQSQEKRDKESN